GARLPLLRADRRAQHPAAGAGLRDREDAQGPPCGARDPRKREGLSAPGAGHGEVPCARALRSGDGPAQAGDARAAAVDARVRRGAHAARRRVPATRGDHGRHALRHRDQPVPAEVARPLHRRADPGCAGADLRPRAPAPGQPEGPCALRYPRDKAPGETPPAAEVAPLAYGSWDVLRPSKGKKDCAILAVGVMCQPVLAAAEALAAEGLDVTVVNCRFLKPIDRAMLDALVREHRLLVTVEDGTVTNGFGAYLAGLVETVAPEVRVVPLGAPDRT